MKKKGISTQSQKNYSQRRRVKARGSPSSGRAALGAGRRAPGTGAHFGPRMGRPAQASGDTGQEGGESLPTVKAARSTWARGPLGRRHLAPGRPTGAGGAVCPVVRSVSSFPSNRAFQPSSAVTLGSGPGAPEAKARFRRSPSPTPKTQLPRDPSAWQPLTFSSLCHLGARPEPGPVGPQPAPGGAPETRTTPLGFHSGPPRPAGSAPAPRGRKPGTHRSCPAMWQEL